MSIPEPEPRVARFEKMAFGLFLHWGLYSLLGRGEWVMEREGIPADEYARLKDRFDAKDFRPREIAKMAKQAGMKYITLTTRHHDGFSLYDTKGLNQFDAPHSAAGRDLIAEFVEGCRAEGIMPVFYHTTLDWRWDTINCDEKTFSEYLDYLFKSVETLCSNYGEIGGLWFDGNWSRPDADWKLDRLYTMIHEKQPEALIVNNTGLSHRGEFEHPEIDSVTFEQGVPGGINREGAGKYVAGEMCKTMNSHWGIGFNDFNYMSMGEMIENLALCRKVGANYLLNVGPTPGGVIPEYEAASLRRMGEWAKMHSDAVYASAPVHEISCQGKDFLLKGDDGKYYYFTFNLEIAGHAHVTVSGPGWIGPRGFTGFNEKIKKVRWMDNDEKLDFTQNPETGLTSINCTGYPYGTDLVVRVAEIEV